MIGKIAAAIAFGVLAATSVDAASIAALAQPSQDWARERQAKKLDDVLALYTPDAVFLDAGGSRVTGQASLRKFFASVLAQYSAMPSLHSVDSSASGDLGYDWGDYSEVITPVASPAGAIQMHGTYLVILRRVSGHWLIAEQMWTAGAPVPVKK